MSDERSKRNIAGERMLRIADEAGRSIPPGLDSSEGAQFLQYRAALLLLSDNGLVLRLKDVADPHQLEVFKSQAQKLLELMNRLTSMNYTNEVLPPLRRVYDPTEVIKAGAVLPVQNPDFPGDVLKILSRDEVEAYSSDTHHVVVVVGVTEMLANRKTQVLQLGIDVTESDGYKFLHSLRYGGRYRFAYYSVPVADLQQNHMLMDE